jgi:hypothetical protein
VYLAGQSEWERLQFRHSVAVTIDQVPAVRGRTQHEDIGTYVDTAQRVT